MKIVVKSAEGGVLRASNQVWSVAATVQSLHMGDLNVTTSLVPGSKWILRGLKRHFSWARKSISLVLKEGKKFWSKILTIITTLSEKQVKSLGKLFDYSLKETAAIQRAYGDLGA